MNNRLGLLERQREQILADCQADILKQQFQDDCDRSSIQQLNESIESQKRRRNLSCSPSRRTTSTRSTTSSWTVIEAKLGSSRGSWWKPQWNGRIEEVSEFYLRHDCEKKIIRGSGYSIGTYWPSTGIAERNRLYGWFERFSICWISTQWIAPLWQSMIGRSWGMPSRTDEPPGIWDTWYIGERFCKSICFLFSTLFAGIVTIGFSNIRTYLLLTSGSQAVKNGIQTPVLVQRCQSEPSPKSSVIPFERDSSKDPWCRPTTTADLRSSFRQIHHANNICLLEDDSSLTSVHVHNFLQKFCGGSKRWKWLSQCMIKKNFLICMRNSNARFCSRCEDCISNEQQFLSWKTDCLRDLRVLPGHWSQWFCRDFCPPTYCCSSKWWCFEEFDSKWDGILLSMTKISSDDILEWLYKLRIGESEKPKTVMELCDLQIHQKKGGPDYHRLKTMVKRSIVQSVRNRNFGTRNGNYRRNALVKNQVREHHGQRLLGDCWQANGQCSKRDSCSFRHDMNKSFSEFFMKKGWKESKKRSPRGRSSSGSMFRLLCLHQFILWKVATSRLHDQEWKQIWKKALMHNVSLMNNPATGIKIMVTKNAVAMLKKNLHESM